MTKEISETLRIQLRQEADKLFEMALWKVLVSEMFDARRYISRLLEVTSPKDQERTVQLAKYQGEIEGMAKFIRLLCNILDVDFIPGFEKFS